MRAQPGAPNGRDWRKSTPYKHVKTDKAHPAQVLEVAELSSALANPERLTQRQQLTIAMKLSRSGQRDQRRQTPPVHHGADSALMKGSELAGRTFPGVDAAGEGRWSMRFIRSPVSAEGEP